MATFRGSNHQISASSVWTNGDLANIIDNLFRQSIRAGASGDYERGLRDMAQAIADATNTEIDLYPDGRYDLCNVNVHAGRTVERYERITERYTPPPTVPERRFAIRGEREAWPAVEDAAPVNMTGDDVNITLFNPTKGRLVTRQIGHAWLGNDGYQAYWNASDWQRVTVEEARAWGNLVPDDWAVLVRHAYANDKRRQLGQSVRVLERERRLLR